MVRIAVVGSAEGEVAEGYGKAEGVVKCVGWDP